jgi:hypothetical protein
MARKSEPGPWGGRQRGAFLGLDIKQDVTQGSFGRGQDQLHLQRSHGLDTPGESSRSLNDEIFGTVLQESAKDLLNPVNEDS